MQTTFYLKYRPQNFSDLDSKDSREELEKIFSSGKTPHAFLFSGPKGIGKTSAARIVAKAINCEKKVKENEPCNECESCKSITAGTNIDIIEIDAASNRGIDDIKELRDKIRLSPALLKYKVYIIDEVHMLTTEAFNALLKTLEEPPEHAIFILCTTDTEKLPKTIISRCQRINFKKANKEEIVGRLKKICEAEKLECEDKALVEITKLSDGSFRDAVKTLEQVSFSGKISLDEVRKTAGILAEFEADGLLLLLKENKIKEALDWVGKATAAGVNLKILIENIAEKLRQILLKNFGVVQEENVMTDFSFIEAKKLIALFSRAYNELKSAVIVQLPLEMAIIEWATINDNNNEGEVVNAEEDEDEVEGQKESAIQDSTVLSGKSFDVSLEAVQIKWSEILEKVKPLNHSVQAFLRACRPIAIGDGFLTLEVFYKFHKEQLETEKCRRIFEQVASEVIAIPVKLKCVLGEKPVAKKPETPDEPEENKPEETVGSPKLADADIMKIAEEIFNGATVN